MPEVLEENLPHAARRDAAAAPHAGARVVELVGAHLRHAHVGFAGEDVEHAGAEVGQLGEETRGFGAVEGVGGGASSACTAARVQVRVGESVDGEVLGRVAVVVGAGEGEDFLVEGCREGYWPVFTVLVAVFVVVKRVNRRGQIAQAVFHPAVEDARVPGLVERVPLEALRGGFARGPDVSSVSRELGRRGDVPSCGVEAARSG